MEPNRGHIATEQRHPSTTELDALSTVECVELLASDHLDAIRAVQQASTSIAEFVDAVVKRSGRLIYIGCGTSGRLGVLDAAECPPTFQADAEKVIGIIAGGDASLRTSSEAKEDVFEGAHDVLEKLVLSENDAVLGIAAGGTTPWVHGGLAFAKSKGALTGFLTCSNVHCDCDLMIHLNTGPEPLTGSTRLKAGTATKLTLNIITTSYFTKLGKVYGNYMVDLKATNDKLMDRGIRIIEALCDLNRDEARTLLVESGKEVKTAIVMHHKSVSKEDAINFLAEADGHLRQLL